MKKENVVELPKMVNMAQINQNVQGMKRQAERSAKTEKKMTDHIGELTAKTIRQETMLEEMTGIINSNGEQTEAIVKRLIYSTNLLSYILINHGGTFDFEAVKEQVDTYIQSLIKGPNAAESKAKFEEAAEMFMTELAAMKTEYANADKAKIEGDKKEKSTKAN